MYGRRDAPVCRYYLDGSCRFGDRCKFSHPGKQPSGYGGQSMGQDSGRRGDTGSRQREVCRFFANNGWCKFGDKCRYHHDRSGGGGGGGGGTDRNTRGGYGERGRHQGNPDVGRSWNEKGRNQFEVFNDDMQSSNHQENFFGRQSSQGFGSRNSRYSNQTGTGFGSTSRSLFDSRNSGRGREDFHHGGNYRSGGGGGGGGGGRERLSSQSEIDLSNPNSIAPAIQEDMKEWRTSKMWPLSCYAFVKDGDNMPGFCDKSPEELRWDAYQAIASGAASSYKELVKSLEQNQMKLWEEYASISPAVVTKLLSSSQSGGLLGIASTGTQGPLFASSNSGATPSSLFGSNQPLFGPSPSHIAQSPVLTSPSSQQHGGLFSGLNQSSTLGLGSLGKHSDPAAGSASSAVFQGGVKIADVKTELTDSELQAYKADKFTLGHIPERPPPEVLC